MGILDSVLADDRFAFNDADIFGESATYKPKSGTTRAIKVVINRNVPPFVDSQNVVRYPLLISVVNSATYGISSTELDTGADKISLPFRYGGTAQDFALGVPESQDAGQLTFRLLGSSR